MPSLAETFGAVGYNFFVPGNVIASQSENQAMLQERADRLNAGGADTIAIAGKTGILSDGDAKQALQDMNRSLFLANDSQRQLGEETLGILLESAAKAPSTAINFVSDEILKPTAGAVSGTIKALVPWQIWLIVGTAVILGIGILAYLKGKTL